MLIHRLIFGPILIAVLLGLFWADAALETSKPDWPVGVVLAALAAVLLPLGAIEFGKLLQAKGAAVNTVLASAGAVVAAWAVYCPSDQPIAAAALVVTFAAAMIWHLRRATIEGAMAAAGATLLIVVVLGVMGGFYLAMRHDHNAWVVLSVMLVTKSGDIGAYFTGSAVGKHKMIPWLSPKKTWEGLGGAVALATIVGVLLAWLGGSRSETFAFSIWDGALCGVVFSLVGHGGDLMFSAFKRDAAVKDSGSSLPGFGGVLDVIDSPLLVGPVAYWLLRCLAA